MHKPLGCACFTINAIEYRPKKRMNSARLTLHLKACSRKAIGSSRNYQVAPRTPDILGHDELDGMKPDACIINISSPDVVNRGALLDALRTKRIGGFALDPLYKEPADHDDELLQFKNVVLTPHLAGSPRANALRDFEDLIVGIAREVQNER